MLATLTHAGAATVHSGGHVTRAVLRRPAGRRGARTLRGLLSAVALAVLALGAAPAGLRAETLLNVSYDPTRELYREVSEAFAAFWVAQGNETPTIEASHGGFGSQARALIDGLEAQVVTLALASDIDKIAQTGKLPADWQTKLPHNSSPYTSTIVFLVREGNPKGIRDWGDLVAEGAARETGRDPVAVWLAVSDASAMSATAFVFAGRNASDSDDNEPVASAATSIDCAAFARAS